MALPTKAPLKRSFARNSYAWVSSIADIAEPIDTELNALSAFNMSCTTFSNQEQPTSTTEKVELPLVNCETETSEVNGSTKHTAPDFMLSFDPQSAPASVGKKAWEALDDLADGYLVRRQDADPNTEFAEGDYVDIWPAQLAVKVPGQTSNDASGVYAFTVGISITGSPEFNVEVVAA